MLKDLPVSTLTALANHAVAGLEVFNHKDRAVAAAEEFQELCVHLCRFANGKDRPDWEHGMREELADALICWEQMARRFYPDVATLDAYVLLKLAKGAARVQAARETGIGKERVP